MAEILKQIEDIPASYPAVPSGLSDAADALDHDALWQRIEGHVAHRWTAREVRWTICADESDEFVPPLAPLVSHTAERWEDGAYTAVTLSDGPVGLSLPRAGVYRISAQVGAGPVPAAVSEAFRRLAEYSAETDERPGATRYAGQLSGTIQESFDRHPTWQARALQYSGAADLLRKYRRP